MDNEKLLTELMYGVSCVDLGDITKNVEIAQDVFFNVAGFNGYETTWKLECGKAEERLKEINAMSPEPSFPYLKFQERCAALLKNLMCNGTPPVSLCVKFKPLYDQAPQNIERPSYGPTVKYLYKVSVFYFFCNHALKYCPLSGDEQIYLIHHPVRSGHTSRGPHPGISSTCTGMLQITSRIG